MLNKRLMTVLLIAMSVVSAILIIPAARAVTIEEQQEYFGVPEPAVTPVRKPPTAPRRIEIENRNGLYIIRVPHEKINLIRPHVTKLLTFNKSVFDALNVELVVNGGYFDANNKRTVSYVVIDGKTVLDPTKNPSLMNSTTLGEHLDEILDRTEFRVLDCGGEMRFDIQKHSAPASRKRFDRCKIVHSIQAGPELYPKLTMEEEYFVEKNGDKVVRDSITALKKCARTAIGYKGRDIYLIIATVKHKVTLPELSKICADLKLDKAMNFDGGGSTSLNFKGTDNMAYRNFEIISDKKKSARKLKSFLIIN